MKRLKMFDQKMGVTMAALLSFALLLGGCQTLTPENSAAPQITKDLPLGEAIEHGIQFGGDTLRQVKQLIASRKQHVAAGKQLHKRLLSASNIGVKPLINLVSLYQSFPGGDSTEVFRVLLQSESILSRQLGWILARRTLSPAMRTAVETELTNAIVEDRLFMVYLPEMAEAVRAHRLKSTYTVIRQGLFSVNHVAFAKTMIALDPKKASSDFLDYLAMAPVEELRQLNLQSIDLFAATLMLSHLYDHPASVSHPRFESLFFYAISHNNALAEISRKVLERHMAKDANHMAFLLARLPVWIQLAFVERNRREMTPLLARFFRELKASTSQNDVIAEIDTIQF